MSYKFRPSGNDHFDPYSDSRGRSGRDTPPPQSSSRGGQRSTAAGGVDFDSAGNRYNYTSYSSDEEYQQSRPTGPPSPVHEEWQSSRSPGWRHPSPPPGRWRPDSSSQGRSSRYRSPSPAPQYGTRRFNSSRYRSPSPIRRYGPAPSSQRPASPHSQPRGRQSPSSAQPFLSTGNDSVDRMLKARANATVEELMRDGYSFEEAQEVAMQELDAEIDRVTRQIREGTSQQSGSYRHVPPRGQRRRGGSSEHTRSRQHDPYNDRYGFGPGVQRVKVDEDFYGR